MPPFTRGLDVRLAPLPPAARLPRTRSWRCNAGISVGCARCNERLSDHGLVRPRKQRRRDAHALLGERRLKLRIGDARLDDAMRLRRSTRGPCPPAQVEHHRARHARHGVAVEVRPAGADPHQRRRPSRWPRRPPARELLGRTGADDCPRRRPRDEALRPARTPRGSPDRPRRCRGRQGGSPSTISFTTDDLPGPVAVGAGRETPPTDPWYRYSPTLTRVRVNVRGRPPRSHRQRRSDPAARSPLVGRSDRLRSAMLQLHGRPPG